MYSKLIKSRTISKKKTAKKRIKKPKIIKPKIIKQEPLKPKYERYIIPTFIEPVYTNAEFDFINQEIKILESDIYNALSKSYKIETYYDIIKKYKDTQFDKHLKQFCQNNNQYKDVYKWQFDKVKTEDLYNSIVDSSQITLIKSKITETEENETMINTLLNEFDKEYNEIYSEINNYEKKLQKSKRNTQKH